MQMPTWMTSLLCLVGGLASVGTGVVLAAGQLQRVGRLHQRRHRVLGGLPEGWGTWFAQGFADLMLGRSLVFALGVLTFWTGLGLWLAAVGLGLT